MRIELCGPLGIGKTTLAQKLSESTGWYLVQEPVETNPFLRAFYQAPRKYAFEKNLFFLLDYLHEIKSRAVGDFIFDHSAVVHRSYAALNHLLPHEKTVFSALDKAIEALGDTLNLDDSDNPAHRKLANMGIRNRAVIPFLSRTNPINKYLGIILARLGLR